MPYRASRSRGSIRRSGTVRELVMREILFDSIKCAFSLTPIPPTSIQGFASGTISFVTLVKFLVDLRSFVDAGAEALFRDAGDSRCYSPTAGTQDGHDNIADMYWRTLIGNNTRREGYTITRETFDSFKRELGECAEMCLKSGVYRNSDTRSEVQGMANTKASQELELAIENVIMSDSQFMKFLGPFWICLQNRKLFTTDTGRFGFSSMHMEKGDVLCVFNGATTAHVLRSLNDGDTKVCRLLGEAYVHGCMNGEIANSGLAEQDLVVV
ncbi:hypothetical protein F4808DRAFT_33689 [Astrocystis sublimbata]|nr:hypothetical protein F4808DRAFT_468654 [Astrocystis sublimbata]KAI0189672.1 hypothetical protein F4808DRAFT_465867 [Astrocystis sublimbata]KAI0189679.1 hypothetical protein F4808DRAFT_33689 [Astrocystis sublimbata]